ncbi:hypothetical protein R1sor_027411 [Riccia sorocarpa]|uniref:MABP1/WDR62 second WD40 domain-containing protein n=1 Tax=Riccia sorocarpa TaxID=122646 RepID=A0ABD3GE60_9MARC
MRLVRRKCRKPEASKLELERVIGLTTTNANGLASIPATGDIVYLAGCVVVVYNVNSNSQTKFLTAPKNQKAFSCVTCSYSGGKYIAAGETGHQPAVVIWETATGACVGDLRTHKYGVSCVEFSPNGKYLLSIGVPHDGFLCLWDWKGSVLLSKTKSTAATMLTSSVHFSSDGNFFVTGGTKHLKHWTVGGQSQGVRARSAAGPGTTTLDGRPVKLGSQTRSSFVAVSCARPLKENASEAQPLYALTTTGVLCLLHCGVAIEKWVDLRVQRGYGLAVSETHVACACSDGIVRAFVQGSLAYAATMPRPAPYGFHGLTDGNAGMVLAMGQRLQPGIKFPDAIACQFLLEGKKLAVIYGDHSLFVWDVENLSKIGKYCAFLSHSSCIWDVKTLPACQWESTDSETSEKEVSGAAIATCSSDGSVRLWNMSLGGETEPILASSRERPANIYSKELLGVLYLDSGLELKEKTSGGGSEDEFLDTTQGFRSICASPDGLHLAAGDRCGNLRVFDLETMKLISFQEAHDAEILSLSFTSMAEDKTRVENKEVEPLLLASGSRDRLIHVYDVKRGYDVIETLDDHTASITAVKFHCNGSKLLSCSADKSVVFRNVTASTAGYKSVRYHQEVAPRGTVYDLDVDATEKFVVTVGQDKKINVLNLSSGKPVRSFKPEGDAGEAVKIQFDPSGAYVVCSHADKCLRVYDFSTGEVVAQAAGHSEIITGVTFLPDCRHLVSVSGDTCIFVWKLPVSITRAMKKRSAPQGGQSPRKSRTILRSSRNPLRNLRLSTTVVPIADLTDEMSKGTVEGHNVKEDFDLKIAVPTFETKVSEDKAEEGTVNPSDLTSKRVEEQETPAFKFSVSRLPPWAQAKVTHEVKSGSGGKNKEKSPIGQESFESRWAERLGSGGYKLFSEFMEELTPPATIRPSEFGTRRRFTLEGCTTVHSQNTPDSVCSQRSDSSSADPLRKETVWKTVHTVYFDELDFPQDDSPGRHGLILGMTARQDDAKDSPKLGHLDPGSGRTRCISPGISQGDVASQLCRYNESKLKPDEEDGVVVYLSDTEADSVIIETQGAQHIDKAEVNDDKEVSSYQRQPAKAPVEESLPSEIKEEIVGLVLQEAGCSDVSRSSSVCSGESCQQVDEAGVLSLASPKKSLLVDEDDAVEGDVEISSSCADHFNERAGEFALEMPTTCNDTSLLQEDDLETNPGRLLAAERERLKLRERQDKMAVEVQRMRERLVNLGITVAEIANEGESFDCRKGAGDDRQPEQASPTSETLNCIPSSSPSPVKEFGNEAEFSTPASTTPFISSSHNLHATPSLFSFAQFCKLPSFPRKVHCVKEGLDDKTPQSEKKASERFVKEAVVATPRKERKLGAADAGNRPGKLLSIISTKATPDAGPPLSSQPLLTNIYNVLQPSAHLSKSPMPSTSMSFMSVEDNLSPGESCGTTSHGNSPKEEIVEITMTCTGAGWDFSPMKLMNQEGANPTVGGPGRCQQEVEQNGPSCPPSDATMDSPLSEPSMPIYLPRCKQVGNPVEDYKIALQELVEAAERASALFDQVRSSRPESTASSFSQDEVNNASQKLLPEALHKVQKLVQEAGPFRGLNGSPSVELCGPSDSMTPVAYSDHCFMYRSSPGSGGDMSFSRPQTGVSIASDSLSLVDIEGFIDRYSTRFSQTLASQVLSLVQKGLNEEKSSGK